MKNKFLSIPLWVLIFSFFYISNSFSQIKEIGINLQLYPTGVITTIAYDSNFGQKNNVSIYAGLNIFNHRDLGVQDTEKGSGYGMGVAYRRYLKDEYKAWRIGVKTDVWRNTVDWTDDIMLPIERKGITKIVVVQPTAEVSYVIRKSNWSIVPNIAFGFEWNVSTDGEPTGEGPIVLVGIQLNKKL